MEITVRTYDEISSERVRIEVPPGQRITIDIDGPVSNLVYDPEAAAEVMVDNYQRARAVAADLQTGMAKLERELADTRAELERATRGHVCTERCEENKHVAFLGRQRLDEAERELANERERAALAERLAQGYDEDRKAQRKRADELAYELDHRTKERDDRETTRAHLEKELASARASALPSARENTQAAELAASREQLTRIAEVVSDRQTVYAMRDALNRYGLGLRKEEKALARAVAAVRDTYPAGQLRLDRS